MKKLFILTCLLLTGCAEKHVISPRSIAYPVPPRCIVVDKFIKPCVKDKGNRYKCSEVEISIRLTPSCKDYDLNTISVEMLKK